MTAPREVAFRADASLVLGNGHVMRCLALAGHLRSQGMATRFICAQEPGHLGREIEKRGHRLDFVPCEINHVPGRIDAGDQQSYEAAVDRDAAMTIHALAGSVPAWLIVDHYRLERAWEQRLRRHCDNLMVIDDLANRDHDCDVLLDQNQGCERADYSGRVKASTRVLLGPAFALLRPEFSDLRQRSLARRGTGELRKLLVSMGGVDSTNVTSRVLQSLAECSSANLLATTVVLGPSAPWLADVVEQATQMPGPCEVRQDPADLAGLMVGSDLCIGAGGTSSWERCCLGLPTVVIAIADNQLKVADALARVGAAIASIPPEAIPDALCPALQRAAQVDQLRAASTASAALCDGRGVERVVAQLALAPG